MVIAKTASRNVAFNAAKMGESVLAGQSVILTREVATAGSSTDEEVLEDLERNGFVYFQSRRYAGLSFCFLQRCTF